MNKRTIGFKIGVAAAALHFCLVMLAFFAALYRGSSTGGLVFLWFYLLDAPLHLLFPSYVFKLSGMVAAIVYFGVFGSALWFLIPWLIDRVVMYVFPKSTREARAIVIVGAILFLLVVVGPSSWSSLLSKSRLSVQGERPPELKNKLDLATSDFLTAEKIFEDNKSAQVSSITRMNCRPGGGVELLLGLSRGVAFLNKGYQEQYRFHISDRVGFTSIEPLVMDASLSCGFLAYRWRDAYLFDLHGKEIWKHVQLDRSGAGIDGARFGDLDGDGTAEFAVYYRDREGIHLFNGAGKMKWKHPVYAVGHLEIADVRGEGQAEIIYTSPYNYGGITKFTVLDSEGAAARQWNISTMSSEFAVVKWPNREAKPNFLLTEDGKIKLVDLEGNAVMQLDAPGCRANGDMRAVTVKFSKEKPEYLAVRKNLHPDLSVLYVYDVDAKLVYQKTEVTGWGTTPALAAVPSNETGAEKLLVGTVRNYRAQVFEYSLANDDP